MKKIIDRLARWVFTVGGFTTSIVILLIIVFLFGEAAGLFRKNIVEDGYSVVVNPSNPVSQLSAQQLKQIFDEDITNWEELGGPDEKIVILRLSDLERIYSSEELGAQYEHAAACIGRQVAAVPGIVAFLPSSLLDGAEGISIMHESTIDGKDVFFGKEWYPTATPAPVFGILPLVAGTLWVSLFAILIALPFGLAVSIYMAECASARVRKLLKPVIELLGGIPSVVYGFFGLTVIVPLLQRVFNLPVGESGLAGSIVLAIMALPTIITVSEDALRSCPRHTSQHPRPSTHHPGHHRRRAWRGAGRRSPL